MSSRVLPLGLVCATSVLLSHVVSAQPQTGACAAWDIEYALSANLRLTETPMGKGDGTYKIGPGSTVLRFDDVGGKPGGAVKMLSYSMREAFTLKAKALFFTTTVTVDSRTRTTPNAAGVVAEGGLAEGNVVWSSKVRGYRTDGTLTCDGSLCGSFGAPPPGTSALHIPPNDVQFRPFAMSNELKRLVMPSTFVAKTKMPQQTAFIALTGNEVKRTCVQPKPSP